MWISLYLITLIIGLAVSIPKLDGHAFTIAVTALTGHLIWIPLQWTIMYKKYKLDKFIYVRTVQSLLESTLYLVLVMYTHWAWGMILGLTAIAAIGHILAIYKQDKLQMKQYNEATNETSDAIIRIVNRVIRWIKTNVLRMELEPIEKVQKRQDEVDELDKMLDRFDEMRKNQPQYDESLMHLIKVFEETGKINLKMPIDVDSEVPRTKYYLYEQKDNHTLSTLYGISGRSSFTEYNTNTFDTHEELLEHLKSKLKDKLGKGYTPYN
jgi:hypothetical protein